MNYKICVIEIMYFYKKKLTYFYTFPLQIKGGDVLSDAASRKSIGKPTTSVDGIR